MANAYKSTRPTDFNSDNALARKAMDAIAQIDKEAKQKKLAQLGALESAKTAILERLNEFNHQLGQIDRAMATITGTPVKPYMRVRRNLDEVRERVGLWMQTRSGQKFAARDLVREFPELEGVQVSMFLKPLVHSGNIQMDTSRGIRRVKYLAVG